MAALFVLLILKSSVQTADSLSSACSPAFCPLNPSCGSASAALRSNDWTTAMHYNWSADLVPFNSNAACRPLLPLPPPTLLPLYTLAKFSELLSGADCAFRCWHTGQPPPQPPEWATQSLRHGEQQGVMWFAPPSKPYWFTSALAIGGSGLGSEGQASHDYMGIDFSPPS